MFGVLYLIILSLIDFIFYYFTAIFLFVFLRKIISKRKIGNIFLNILFSIILFIPVSEILEALWIKNKYCQNEDLKSGAFPKIIFLNDIGKCNFCRYLITEWGVKEIYFSANANISSKAKFNRIYVVDNKEMCRSKMPHLQKNKIANLYNNSCIFRGGVIENINNSISNAKVEYIEISTLINSWRISRLFVYFDGKWHKIFSIFDGREQRITQRFYGIFFSRPPLFNSRAEHGRRDFRMCG